MRGSVACEGGYRKCEKKLRVRDSKLERAKRVTYCVRDSQRVRKYVREGLACEKRVRARGRHCSAGSSYKGRTRLARRHKV